MSSTRRFVGSLLTVLGWYCMLCGVMLGLALYFENAASDPVGRLLSLLLAGAGGIAVGWPIGRLGRRVAAEDANYILRVDSRAPIVYLRSFAEDGSDDAPKIYQSRFLTILGQYTGGLGSALVFGLQAIAMGTDEEWLESLFAHDGPMIAVGLPGEKLRRAGAARLYLGQDWQKTVGDLLRRARLVILRIGSTPGLFWEVRKAMELLPPERLLLYLTFRKDRSVLWQRFESVCREAFPKPLPVHIGGYAFLAFDPDGNPRLFGIKGTGGTLDTTDRPAVHASAATNIILPYLIGSMLAGTILTYLGRRCGAWHTAHAGQYASTLSVLLVILALNGVIASESNGDLQPVLGVPAVILFVVFLPIWILKAMRVDGLKLKSA